MSGFLGAIGGLGQGMTSVGKSWADELKQQRVLEMQQKYKDADYARQRGDTQADMELQRGWEKEDTSSKHSNKLAEIEATGRQSRLTEAAKNKASLLGGWKPSDAQKEIRTLAATGLKMNSEGAYDEDQERLLAERTDAIYKEFKLNPDAGPAGAYAKVIGRSRKADDDALALEDIRSEVTAEAKDKAGWFSTDEQDFGPGGRDAWIEAETQRRGGDRGFLTNPDATTGKAEGKPKGKSPYEEGERLIGKDGKLYIVKNGIPKLAGAQ